MGEKKCLHVDFSGFKTLPSCNSPVSSRLVKRKNLRVFHSLWSENLDLCLVLDAHEDGELMVEHQHRYRSDSNREL